MNQPGWCWICRRYLPGLADLTKRQIFHMGPEHGYLGLEEEGGEDEEMERKENTRINLFEN